MSEDQRRAALFAAATATLKAISARMRQAILENASGATRDPRSRADDWSLRLGVASIGMDTAKRSSRSDFGRWGPAFDVIAHAAIGLSIPRERDEYEGRSHSLWYGDLQEVGVYRWYELGFRVSGLIPRRLLEVPAAFAPSENAGQAFANAMTAWDLARPVTPIDQGEEEAFIDRWIGWLGQAVAGELHYPAGLPEGGDTRASYRQR